MKVSQLKPSFDNAERIGEKSAGKSGYGWSYKIVVGSHLFLLKLSKTRKVDVATKTSFESSCDESLIEPLDTILFHDVFARRYCVVEEIVMSVQALESSGRQHESHFDIFEGLQHDCGDCPAYQPKDTILINH